jgi:hypothetical protein
LSRYGGGHEQMAIWCRIAVWELWHRRREQLLMTGEKAHVPWYCLMDGSLHTEETSNAGKLAGICSFTLPYNLRFTLHLPLVSVASPAIF